MQTLGGHGGHRDDVAVVARAEELRRVLELEEQIGEAPPCRVSVYRDSSTSRIEAAMTCELARTLARARRGRRARRSGGHDRTGMNSVLVVHDVPALRRRLRAHQACRGRR